MQRHDARRDVVLEDDARQDVMLLPMMNQASNASQPPMWNYERFTSCVTVILKEWMGLNRSHFQCFVLFEEDNFETIAQIPLAKSFSWKILFQHLGKAG